MGDTLVDNIAAQFGQTVDIGLAGTEVAPFDSVVKKAESAVAVVAVILGRVDATLSRNTMRPPGAVLVTEDIDIEAQFHPGTRPRMHRPDRSPTIMMRNFLLLAGLIRRDS